jgi:hypothetical protein
MDRQMSLPDAFCWTRYGTESGSIIEEIIRRKELERQVAGVFGWGIGNAIGPGIAELVKRQPEPLAVFSKMSSKPAARDVSPDRLVLWHAYRAKNRETRSLPAGVLVISRASTVSGTPKRHYFALFCASDEPLRLSPRGVVSFGSLRNIRTGNRVGAQQTTAVVTVAPGDQSGREYAASLLVRLVPPYCAEVLLPRMLSAEEVRRIDAVAGGGDPAAWSAMARDLRVPLS